MARIVVIVSLFLAACDVGELPGAGGDGGAGDTGNGCVPINAAPPNGHHNAGMGCMSAAQCHNQALGLGVGAPAYSYGGTLYKMDKTTPYAGATIIIKLGTAEKQIVTADNGNFWMVPGVAGLDPPTNAMQASTKASGCPTILPMAGALTQGGGNCNSDACHAAASTQGAIYLGP